MNPAAVLRLVMRMKNYNMIHTSWKSESSNISLVVLDNLNFVKKVDQ